MAPTPRKGDIKFAERRAELGEAALQTLAELGYARTSLREIAQNSEFSHGVLHYYFTDKLDLILCSVRQYKARCVKRYDDVTATATSFDELLDGFVAALGDTLRKEAPLHRLWYDLRAQSLFEEAFRADVAEIDKSLEKMIWRVMSRFAEITGEPVRAPSSVTYAMFDGLFQQGAAQAPVGRQEGRREDAGRRAAGRRQLVGRTRADETAETAGADVATARESGGRTVSDPPAAPTSWRIA